MKKDNLFRIVMDGQKQFVHFPNGERVPGIIKTSVIQDVEMMNQQRFLVRFTFLINGEKFKDAERCSLDFSNTTNIMVNGNYYEVESAITVSDELNYEVAVGIAQVWAYYDFENSKP
jgi:hypothetical protein